LYPACARRSLLLAALALCLQAAGCSSVPDWIDTPPVNSRYLYAVGSYVGSLYPEDNRKNAEDDARARLARQMKTRVIERLRIRSWSTGASFDRRAELIAEASVKNSETVTFWVDTGGEVVDGVPGTVYVLVRAPMPDLGE
jgi:hypothetical protein